MKKFFAILVTMAILVSSVCIALPTAAISRAADYTVTANADYAAKKVSVSVEMTANTGLSTCMLDLTYDANVLTCTSATAGSVWTGDVEVNTANDGIVVFYAVPDNMDAVNTSTGVIFTAEFDMKAGASEDAPFNFALMCAQNDEYNHFVVEGGNLVPVALNASYEGHRALIDAKPVIPAPDAMKFNFTSEVVDGKYYVHCDIADNPGVWALVMNVDYNDKAFNAGTVSITAGDVFAKNEIVDDHSNVGTKPIIVFAENMAGFEDKTANGRLFTLEFDVIDCSKTPDIDVVVDDVINAAGDDVEYEISETYAPLEHKTPAGAAPDCTTGVNCEVCGTEVTPALGHTEVPVAGTPADCENDGLTDGIQCSVCLEWIKPQEPIVSEGHKAAAAVKENEVPADCVNAGSYEEVVYCSVCGEELSRTLVPVNALGHTPAAAVRENEIPADCVNAGSYEEVVYCDVCGEELSRTLVPVDALGHTEATAVRENVVPADCDTDGSYDEVVYCSVCGEELSRTPKVEPALGHTEEPIPGYDADCTNEGLTDGVKCSVCGDILVPQDVIPAKGHTPAAAVKENVVPADCVNAGSYDSVVYCDVCGYEISRTPMVEPALGHKEATAVKENVVSADCVNDGSYDEVVYCSVCGVELSRTAKVEPALGHTPAAAVKENVVAPDCVTDGSYEEVVYCDVCGEELSRTPVVDPAKGHTPAEAVKENEVPADCVTDGSYDEVVYCSVCGEELSRTAKVVPALGHTEEEIPAVAPTCTETGLTAGVKCSVCGETLVAQEVVEATGHTEETIPAVAPTCTEKGLTEGKKCSVCGEVLVAQEEVDALGHLPEEELTLVPGYPATEDKEGLTDALVCGRCDTVISGGEVIEKLPAKTVSFEITASGDYSDATEVVYTFTVDTENYEFVGIDGLAEDAYKVEEKDGEVVITIVDLDALKDVKEGEKLFDLVFKVKGDKVDVEEIELDVKEELKDEEGNVIAPPQTGDNMTFIIIIAVVAAAACVVLLVYSKKRAAKASK